MRVGVVAPPWFEVPPRAYGGIEWLCYWLVEGLVDRGHDVCLVAAGENHTRARFFRTYVEPPSERVGERLPELVHAAGAASCLLGETFDIVHDHSFAGSLVAMASDAPIVVTTHAPVEGETGDYYRALSGFVHLVPISDSQRRMAPDLSWAGRVYNAVDVEDYPMHADKDDFVLFLGRMSPEKAPHLAIRAARDAQFPIILAGKCTEEREHHYFDSEVRPLLDRDVEWIGQADTPTKKNLLCRARCLVFPIMWEEPFGIVMVEAMACGTPVVTLARGAAPEVVDHGVTGYVCHDPSGLAEAVKRAELIDPSECRARVKSRFDRDNMVAGYEQIYRAILHAGG